MDLLAEGGRTKVTVANLCDRLGVTKGSFYHHYRSGPAFLRELLLYWEAGFGDDGLRLSAISDPIERIEFLKHAVLERHYSAEAAIRELARTDTFAHDVQERVSERRTKVLVDTFLAAGIPRARSRGLAEVGMTLLAGLQHSDQPDDRRQARRVFDEYQRWITANTAPTSQDIGPNRCEG
jgi:AcrR family transcriptional regulator